MFLRKTLALLFALAMTAPAWSASWADSMFEELSRDFGAVPMGQVLVHQFRLTNNTGKPVVIQDARASCTKCTSVSVLNNSLAPGQSTWITVQMDTSKFLGPKTVTISVTFAQPGFQEARLLVSAVSREDLSVTPDTLAFGQVKHGDSPTISVKVAFLGGGQARVVGVTSDSNYVQPSIKPLDRNGKFAEYELSAKLRPDVPAGKWYTLVWVKTNDPAIPAVSVPLTVDVTAPLDLSPPNVQLGEVKVGTLAERRVSLRGVQPFKITAIQGVSDDLQVKDTQDGSRQMHVLLVTFKPTHVGELTQTIKIVTDMKEGSDLDFEVRGKAIAEAKEIPSLPSRLLGRRKLKEQ